MFSEAAAGTPKALEAMADLEDDATIGIERVGVSLRRATLESRGASDIVKGEMVGEGGQSIRKE